MKEWFSELNGRSTKWLVAGGAGFIGSHLTHTLLEAGQTVTVIDNLLTGHKENLSGLSERYANKFRFVEADINNQDAIASELVNTEFVLQQAALGSVPRSINNPLDSFRNNVSGFFNLIVAAKEAGVARFVYASSSSVYGDHETLPKVENQTGNLLSPYAATKAADELFADVVARTYGLPCVGLRYFNVFGPRQDPNGPYAAVIPVWMKALTEGKPIRINGDGSTTRDFCYIKNAVQANIKAALAPLPAAHHAVLNVACGTQTSLTELFELIRDRISMTTPHVKESQPVYGEERPGDIKHSLANIAAASDLIGYKPTHDIHAGLDETVDWFVRTRRPEVVRTAA